MRFDRPLPLESLVASLVSALRERLDHRIGARRPPTPDPLAALRSSLPLRTVLEAGVRDPLRRTAAESVASAIRAAIPERSGLVRYGQHEAAWVAHHDVHRRLGPALFRADDLAQLELRATIARSCGWRWPREGVCVVAERPAAVHVEPVAGSAYGESRAHREDGRAVVFRDGWSVYAWHGTALSPWGSRTRLLLAVNGSVERDGTRRRYGLRVPPWFDDPIDAYGLTGPQYALLQRRTWTTQVVTVDLAEILSRTGLSVLDHLEKQVLVPVINGLQAQGDLIVIPLALAGPVHLLRGTRWDTVPPEGVELVRAAAGNNPHTLTADPHTCRWTTALQDPLRLGVAVFDNTTPAYLVHPEHGGTGIAPGTWLVRRQQERGTGFRPRSVLVVD